MKTKWNKSLKDKFGYDQAKDIDFPCGKFNNTCLQPHDWEHNGHLICLTNYNHRCPNTWEMEK